MAFGFNASLDDAFDLYNERFEGLLLTKYGVVGAATTSAQGNGALLAEGTGLHGGDKLRIDPCGVIDAGFCVSLDDVISGAGGVQDGNALWIGLQNGVYNTDPTVSTKSIFFRIAPTGADSLEWSVYAKDGTRTYSFATGINMTDLPSRLQINFARGFKEVQLLIDGKPVLYRGDFLDLSGFLETDWMQFLVYMKGASSNDLRLHHLRVRTRHQKGLVRPPTTSVPA